MISEIINKSQKFKFYLKLQDNEVIEKLIADINNELSIKTEFENNYQMNKIINAIRIASTSRGSTPVNWRQSDFWNSNGQWERKIKKKELNPINMEYANYDSIKKGLNYIKDKINLFSLTTLYSIYNFAVKKIKDHHQEDLLIISDSGIATTLLHKTKEKIKSLNENSRKLALFSIINGYQDICAKFKTLEIQDLIIELLILQEFYSLITKLLIIQEEKKIELIYRSCIDLMSIMIVSKLHIHQANFTEDKNIIFPKILKNSALEKFSSYILVEKTGTKAIKKGLKILDKKLSIGSCSGFQLKTVLSQGKGSEEYKKDIAVYFLLGGSRGIAKKAIGKDDFAIVGRISETIFDIDQEDLTRLEKDVIEWCKHASSKPKTLCINLTITKPKDELLEWMQSPEVTKLIEEKKLDILVWQSEQKQQSLGTGKFSAGSVFLLSSDEMTVRKFNQMADEAYKVASDCNLSTFFRHYCIDAMHEVVKQQSESAKFVADRLNPVLQKCYGAKAVANGSFVIIITDNVPIVSSLLEEKWPKSFSYGFSQTTLTHWDTSGTSSIRVSIGLESKEMLTQEVSEIISKFEVTHLGYQ